MNLSFFTFLEPKKSIKSISSSSGEFDETSEKLKRAMSKPYKLSVVLYGHSLDVRAIAITPDNSIISGSRDRTAKFWKPNEFNTGYVDSMTYKDQQNFIGAVLYLEPFGDFPAGLIITGGTDNTILIYKPNEPFATFTIKEHKDSVCCLSKANDKSEFISSSWDKTAKLWSINNLKFPVATFAGHAAALWSAIQLKNGTIATACADKTIALWENNGQQIMCFTGHSDCVRALCDFPDLEQFLSVANDAQIKVWNYAGENLCTYYGHNNYIYCISRNLAGGANAFVTGDENFSVKYWKDGENVDTIKLPAQSVWAVGCLTNGDIVTGSSDGVIRVFSQDESRHAEAEAMKQFEEELNAVQMHVGQEIGGYKVADLPGREALYDPGKKPGQTKMIRESGTVIAYSWVEDDAGNGHWEKVGNVMGANEKTNDGKTLHQGKYYDYVFSVDVEDGKPPLKLPYNKGEDVYEAANKFIVSNYLPAVYLDQVVDFIQKNSQDNQPLPSSDYVDPFTGASRYQPASTSSGLGASAGINLDPLTGGNSYTTSSSKPALAHGSAAGGNADPFTGASSYTTTPQQTTSQYFPHQKYLRFEAGDPKVILGKLKEFNGKLDANHPKTDDIRLGKIVDLCTSPADSEEVIEELYRLLDWPQDLLFPVIDVLRLAMRQDANCNQIILKDAKKLSDFFKTSISQSQVPNNVLLVFRTLCNMFNNSLGEEFIHSNQLEFLETISSLPCLSKNIEIALSTFLLNLTISCIRRNDEVGIILLSSVLPDAINNCKDPESHFRSLVGLGNLLSLETSVQSLEIKGKIAENAAFSQKLKDFTRDAINDLETKRMNCAKQLQPYL